MKKVILFIIVLLIVGIIAFTFYAKSFLPKYRWEPEYSERSVQPYGFKYFYDFLSQQKKGFNKINNCYDELDTTEVDGNFICLKSYLEMDSLEVVHLIKYISKGNKALIITEYAPLKLLASFIPVGDTIHPYADFQYEKINVTFPEKYNGQPKSLFFRHKIYKTYSPTNWNGYSKNYFDSKYGLYDFYSLSSINDSVVNSFYINHGKGTLMVHSSPLLFSNYYITQKNGLYHAQNILSHMNNGPIYWYNDVVSNDNENRKSGFNPLKFLFTHFTLKTGWYVFLFSIFLYLVFRSKRQQRIIPMVYKNKNTSVEFVKAVGSLFYKKKQHHSIVNELYHVFLYDIRSRYNISTSLETNELIGRLVFVTKLDKEYYEDLFTQFKSHKNSMFTTSKDLIYIYSQLEIFYNLKK